MASRYSRRAFLQTGAFAAGGAAIGKRVFLDDEAPGKAFRQVAPSDRVRFGIIGPQAGVDTSPSYYASSFPSEMRAEYRRRWYAEHGRAPGQEPMSEATEYRGNHWDDVRPHMWDFFQAVRSRGPIAEDAVFGDHAAIACHLANESYVRGGPVAWDAASNAIIDAM